MAFAVVMMNERCANWCSRSIFTSDREFYVLPALYWFKFWYATALMQDVWQYYANEAITAAFGYFMG